MNKLDLEKLILRLLEEKSEVGVHDVAQSAGLSKSDEAERKAIRRAFHSLMERGLLEAQGSARARVYIRREQNFPTAQVLAEKVGGQPFADIALSPEAKRLLRYLSRPLKARKPVGYNQNFLRAYKPNRTYYLSRYQRAELMSVGLVEKKERPAGTYARNIFNRLLIDLSFNSSRLEGNTYSLLETQRLLEFGENATGKDAAEAQMILNHKGAIEYIIESANEELISSHEICSIHALLSENLLGDASASGRLRMIAVGVAGSTYLPIDNPHLLRDCFQVFLEKLNLIEDPFEQSLFSLIQLCYLQSFEDVNKRTARLVANIPLIKKNLKPLSFTDVDRKAHITSLLGVYEKNDISLMRELFVWAYKRSAAQYTAIQQSLGAPNLLKMKYRSIIAEIVRAVILEKIEGQRIVKKIKSLISKHDLPQPEASELFSLIEREIMTLHDGNIARYKIRPSEFQAWKKGDGAYF